MKSYDSYKPTNISWLPQVPTHWGELRAKNMYKKEKRPALPESEIVTCFRDGIVTLRSNRRTTGFTESLKEYGYQRVCIGDLVLHEMDAFAGSIGVSDSDGKCTPVYSCCIALGKYDNYYYAYLLREMARRGYIQSLYRGIRERTSDFRYEMFGRQTLVIPPYTEQIQIRKFLDWKTADIARLIAAKKKQITLLNEQKRAVINSAVTRGLNPDAELKDSGVTWLGQIPAHWEVIRNAKSFQITKEIVGQNFVSTQLLSLTTNGVREKDIEEKGGKQPKTFDGYQLVEKNNIIMCLFDLDCSAVFSGISKYDGMITSAYKVLKCRENIMPQYADYWFRYIGADRKFKAFSKSLRYTLNYDEFKVLPILLPSVSEQKRIVEYLDKKTADIDNTVAKIRTEIALLHEYRTRLISDAVTGQIDLRDIVIPENIPIKMADDKTDGENETEEFENAE
jgi:type I restriction enzyme S subunit